MSGEHFEPDVDRCHKCGARFYQNCNRYRLQFPVVCPRNLLPRAVVGFDPDQALGARVCDEALRDVHERFPHQVAETSDERVDELDFNVEEYRR